jgi:hypothetical protein
MTFYTGDCLIEVTAWTGLTVDILAFIFSSPDPKGHVSYSHHLASVSVVRRKLFQKSSPLKVLDQWKPNLV